MAYDKKVFYFFIWGLEAPQGSDQECAGSRTTTLRMAHDVTTVLTLHTHRIHRKAEELKGVCL